MIATTDQLTQLESLIGTVLPSDYRLFMLEGDASSIEELEYWMPHPDGQWIERVIALHLPEYLLKTMEMEIDLRRQGFGDHPNGTLPIADNGCGDSILLSYRDQDFGAVYHEFLEEGDMDDHWRGVYALAGSFSEWMSMLTTLSKDDEE